MRSPPRDTITQLAECLLGRADRYRLREFGIHESDGAPDVKESRPKHEPPGYQACMMRGEMWPRRQERVSRPDASPPRCAQLMGLASRGCLVLVLGATAERRNLFFRSDLGLPWIRTLDIPPIQVKQTVKCVGPSVQRASRRPSPNSCSRPRWAGSTASTPISPDIDEQIEARLAPFQVDDDPGHQGPRRRRPGRSAGTPGARAGAVLHQKKRSQPTPVAVARCGNQHLGGGCCASSRSLP